jgi:hypothetical protein
MKKARKVALISIFDYPRELYSAYWEIQVKEVGDGYVWAAEILSLEPVSWTHDGVTTPQRPDVPMPVYPPDLSKSATSEQQEARRKLCYHIYEANPKPDFRLEAHDWTTTPVERDEADAAAQQWVLGKMPAYKRNKVASLTDEKVAELVVEFDLSRAACDLGRVDMIRGRLKAHGIKLREPESIGSPNRTTWKRA